MSSRNLLDIRKKEAKREAPRTAPTSEKRNGPKPVRLKVRRRRQRIIAACICLLGAAGLLGGIAGASHLEQLAINAVSVQGAQKIQKDALSASVQSALTSESFSFFSRKNIFLYPKSAIESTLSDEFPRIKAVSLSRESLLAQAVVVSIEERKPFAQWCSDTNECFEMDDRGFIFAQSGDKPQTDFVFHGGLAPGHEIIGQNFLRGRMPATLTLFDALNKAGFKVAGLTVESEKDMEVQLNDGPELRVSFDMSAEDVVHNLTTALEAEGLRARLTELEYIDLRFGNRVYYK